MLFRDSCRHYWLRRIRPSRHSENTGNAKIKWPSSRDNSNSYHVKNIEVVTDIEQKKAEQILFNRGLR